MGPMTDAGAYSDDLNLAVHMTDVVDEITLSGFRSSGLKVEHKEDTTPVTEIDRAAEQAIRDLLARNRPNDAVHGEEFGATGSGPRRWVIDPVDGTKNYIRGIPVWGTLIALLDEGVPVLGVVSAPALGQRWFAARGEGAWKGNSIRAASRIHVSEIDSLDQATLSYSSLSGWEQRGMLDQFLEFQRGLWRTRAFGDFWSYMMVAEGVVEIASEPELALWDMAALVTIVEEAGGTFTSLTGEAGAFGADAVATNGLLHDEVSRALAPPR